MAGEVEQARATGLQAVAKDADGVLQLLLRGVEFQVDREACLLKDLGHRCGVVDGIQQRRARVACVTHHQRVAWLLRRQRSSCALQRAHEQGSHPGQPGLRRAEVRAIGHLQVPLAVFGHWTLAALLAV